ncbi:ubiquinone/menaquinone biosynthesis methyltransferase [Streptomyces sp. S465]|uniref:ubiquinone/menaquinone biosynthesis methyltransferase n=1 Tax=Streptomyces sp. S465 TaxID=2979468 RepID=UPI0022A85F98|nr:ubiquinone/menaquinone biosynthesis methyltransferase [Streptomyces sp. S465]WAP54907.1 ubiquinone/menaquinone biosynthesis methyltransferase [Streptomyces sp. S465]
MTSADTPYDKGSEVRGIFEKIAGYYDRMNFVMTLGRHAQWCREVAARVAPAEGGRLVDLATGTGVIALEMARRYPDATVTGVDFSAEMLRRAKSKPGADAVCWRQADAMSLPFEDESFDGITQGYLLRNVADLDGVLREQFRVLKPGGRIAILETCPPSGLMKPVMRWGIRFVVPLLGQIVARDRKSYTYLESSTLAFASPEHVAGVLRGIGFRHVRWRKKFFGTNVILWATKPR